MRAIRLIAFFMGLTKTEFDLFLPDADMTYFYQTQT